MAMRRENVAAALKYLQDKANLRQRFERATSLDPQEQDLADIAVETAASFVPGVGQALAARDVERARRADDPAGMAMATMGAIPGGRLAGLLKRYDPVMQQLDVYHGTPHRFPATEANPLGEFDASKIGTGEGAQAYGHGIYYAESPDIAKHYQTQLGKFYDQMQTPEGAMSLEEAVTKYHPDGKIAAKVLSTFRTKTDVDTFNKVINDEILPEIRAKYPQSEWNKFAPQQGTLYKADLPDEMIDRMLDWDKPLSEQRELATPILKELGYLRPNDDGPRQFSQAVKALALEHGGFGESGATGMALFNAIYKGLQQGKPKAINLAKRMNLNEQEMFMEASPLASEVMKRMGIPGIKYLDAGSRGQGGSGTRNFVVFPGEEKKVRILERDGQKAPPQKIAQALEAAPRKPEMAFDAPEVKPGDIVDGLKVRPEVANVGSIKASLDNYTVLPGIRSVSIADFGEAGPLTGNVEKLDRRTRNLADQITESKEITPLIVVYSGSQNYILEGSHRIDALDALGKKRIPVIAVIDEDDPPKFMRQKR